MYQSILVPTDGSAGASAALEEAIGLAAEFDATVHVLNVVDVSALDPETGAVDLAESFEQMGEEIVDAAATRARDAGVEATADVVTGTPHRSILDYLDDEDVDLVVMGTHGRTGLERFLLGSVTEKVVRTADAPVLTVRAAEDEAESKGVGDGEQRGVGEGERRGASGGQDEDVREGRGEGGD